MLPLPYPRTPTVNQVDDYHGTAVADPYRWLEDTESAETAAWVAAQNEVTFAYLATIPARAAFKARITELWDYAKALPPLRRGDGYFQLRNDGLQNQDVLYMGATPAAADRVLLDPNTLSEDGTIALSQWVISPDGAWLAYAVSASGSDWITWRVREVASGRDLDDELQWSKFTAAAWARDSSGFYYARYDPPAAATYTSVTDRPRLSFHQLGTDQAADRVVYERPDHKSWSFEPTISDDGRYLVLFVSEGTDRRNRLFYQDLRDGGPVVELIPELEAAYDFVGNDGRRFYCRTDKDAPRGRLIAIDLDRPAPEAWQTLIPEQADNLELVQLVHDEFVAAYLHDAQHQLKRFDRDGRFLGEIPLPGPGALSLTAYRSSLSGRRQDDELFYGFWSFLYPETIYRFDFASGASQVLFQPELDFDPTAYETRQVFVTSKDGTRVPLFLTGRRDQAPDGQTPVLLYGYGGFDIALTPSFSPSRLAWLEQGGIFASANLRGGGEYGAAWHQAGTKTQKQNVFDDFIACAEWLIEAGITSPARLAITGGSNGGLLVAACMTQRPDLFGAVVPQVGVLDMLRYHKFTIGWAWASDYGTADDADEFAALYAYSPLHTLQPGTHYPPTLTTTGDHDDRVVPGHSFKFAAALQAAQGGDAPVLIRIQTRAGHGQGKPTAIIIEEIADIYAFLARALGME